MLKIDFNMLENNDENWREKLEYLLQNIKYIEKSMDDFTVLQQKLCRQLGKLLENDIERDRAFHEMAKRTGTINVPAVQKLIDIRKAIIRTESPTSEPISRETSISPIQPISSERPKGNVTIPIKIPCIITPKTERSDGYKTAPSSSSKQENLIHCEKDKASKKENLIHCEKDKASKTQKSTKKFALDEIYFRYPAARNLAFPTPQFNMALLADHVNDLIPNVLKRKHEKTEPEAEAETEEKQNMKPEYPKRKHTDSGQVVIIGPNNTEIRAHKFDTITWTSAAAATRAVLINIFDDDTLSTHTLTGKPSPAFHDRQRPSKQRLDPLKIDDIIHCVMMKCRCTEREIRAAITSKCADTAKKYKKRVQTPTE